MQEGRPVLAGDEQGPLLVIIGDTVQQMGIDEPRGIGVQAVEIDSARDFPCLRREAHKVIGLPDIGIDLAVHIFELIQEANFTIGVLDDDIVLDLAVALPRAIRKGSGYHANTSFPPLFGS
jgi:hypothetical protein